MFTMCCILVWLLLGLWGYGIASNTYFEIMKTTWWDKRKMYMPLLIGLGPLNLIGQFYVAYKFKEYWHAVWKTGRSTEVAKLKTSGYYKQSSTK